MRDDVTFEARLADALRRYGDQAPPMDDAAIAIRAIEAGRSTRGARWSAALRQGLDGIAPGRPGLRAVWVVVVLALLLVAVVLTLASGALRNDSRGPFARNGAIAFTVQGNDHGPAGTHLMNADGTGDRPIDAGRCPTYSRDGRVLASLAYEASAYLVVAGADGRQLGRVLLVEAPTASVSYALSPDGLRVAWFKPVEDGAELWVAPVAGGPGTRILAPSSVSGELRDSLSWSPDGGRLAFGSYVADLATGERRRTAISVVAADGSDLRPVTTRPGLLGEGLSWSPDGRLIAYTGLPDAPSSPGSTADDPSIPYPPRDVFVIGADGTGERNLTTSPALETGPEWSPDGDALAFETAADGEAHRLTTIRMNGPTPVAPAALGPESPWFVWSPDGTRLLWPELVPLTAETYRSTLQSIDRDFRERPTALQAVDGQIVCAPSWQRLDP